MTLMERKTPKVLFLDNNIGRDKGITTSLITRRYVFVPYLVSSRWIIVIDLRSKRKTLMIIPFLF
jgi:hypothetical protein